MQEPCQSQDKLVDIKQDQHLKAHPGLSGSQTRRLPKFYNFILFNLNIALDYNVQFQKIFILLPQKGLEFGGGGFCKAKKIKEMYQA